MVAAASHSTLGEGSGRAQGVLTLLKLLLIPNALALLLGIYDNFSIQKHAKLLFFYIHLTTLEEKFLLNGNSPHAITTGAWLSDPLFLCTS